MLKIILSAATSLLATIATTLLITLSVPSWAQTPSHLVIFGNSLSDNGNQGDFCARTHRCTPTPYTNSSNTMEVLANHFSLYGTIDTSPALHYPIQFPGDWNYRAENFEHGIQSAEGHNYAFGGAFVPPENQVGRYLNDVNHTITPNTLHVFFFGANYILQAAAVEIFRDGCFFQPHNCHQLALNHLQSRANEVGRAMQRLIDAGGNQIMIINSDDLSRTPLAMNNFPSDIELIRFYSFMYNHLLQQEADKLSGNGISITHIDALSFIEQVKTQAERFGLNNIHDACYLNEQMSASCEQQGIDSYFYYDELHWASTTHAVFAQHISQTLLGLSTDDGPLIVQTTAIDDGGITTIHAEVASQNYPIASVSVETLHASFAMSNTSGDVWEAVFNTADIGSTPFSIRTVDTAGHIARNFGNVITSEASQCINATLDEHVAADRAYATITYAFWWFGPSTRTYYAIGSDIEIGTKGNMRVDLEENSGHFYPCPH